MPAEFRPWTFADRWRITGTLTAREPLHIGTGEAVNEGTVIPERLRRVPLAPRETARKESEGGIKAPKDKPPEDVDVAAVATDYRGKPYLPGTGTKGGLLSWLEANFRGVDEATEAIQAVFGWAWDDLGSGGLAEFPDAPASGRQDVKYYDESRVETRPDGHRHIPYWDGDRLTGITVSVAIDRRTGTASDKKLFHEEFVPPAVCFAVEITGQGLDESHIGLLLLALEEGFHRDAADPIRLGAGGRDGWGRFEWKLGAIQHLDEAGLAAWLEADDEKAVGYAGLPSASEDVLKQIGRRKEEWSSKRVGRGSVLELEVELQFEGPFLVNDPTRTKHAPDRPKSRDPNAGPPDHAPRLDHQGRLVLPSRSFRGAFRGRAERIARTIHPAAVPVADESLKLDELTPFARLFGVPGWATTLTVSDFLPAENSDTRTDYRQEFVAIDRFTGGSAEKFKFNSDHARRPRLKGTIAVDLGRLGDRQGEAVLGLLALVLRDLVEGDITFGHGASKGYGACRVVKLGRTPRSDATLGSEFAELGPDAARDHEARKRLNGYVEAFRTSAKTKDQP